MNRGVLQGLTLLMVLATAGCPDLAALAQGMTPMTQVDGPGFRVDLPGWPDREPPQSSVNAGALTRGTPYGGVILRWSRSNANLSPDQLAQMLPTNSSHQVVDRATLPADDEFGHERSQIQVDRSDRAWGLVTSWFCAEHARCYLLFVTMGDGRAAAHAMQKRILGSFRCHTPCEVPQSKPPLLPELPDGFVEFEVPNGRGYQDANGAEAISFSLGGTPDLPEQAVLHPEVIPKVAAMMLDCEFEVERHVQVTRADGAVQHLWPGVATYADGGQVRLVLSLWTCPCHHEALLGLYLGPVDSTRDAIGLLQQAVCPQ